MLTTVQKLAKLSIIYVIGDLITKGVSFLLLPLYTKYLTPEDYGILAITAMVIAVLTTIVSFGLAGAVIRFYNTYTDPVERKHFYGAIWVFLILASGGIVFFLLQFGEGLFSRVFQEVAFEPYIRLSLWIVFLNTAFVIIPPALFRAGDQAKQYVSFNLINFSATVIFTIWFVVYQQRGIEGALFAQVGAAFITSIVSILILLKKVEPNINWVYVKGALAFSIPFVPHFLAQWALSVSDRIILERYVGLDQLGLYALGYQFGLICQLLMMAMNNPLMMMFGRAAKDQNEYALLPRMVTYFNLVSIILGVSIILFADELIVLMTPPTFHESANIVFWIVLGYLIMGLYYPAMDALVMIVGSSKEIPFVTMFAAIVNISLNLMFVPKYGVMAAAVNTVIGFTVLSVTMFVIAQRKHPLQYEYSRLGKIAIMAGFILVGTNLLSQDEIIFNISINLIFIALSPIILQVLGFWTEDERRIFKEWKQNFAVH